MTKTINLFKVSNRFIAEVAVVALAFVVMCVPFFADAALLSRQLEFGMSGSDVSDLQIFLAQDNTIYPQGLVTGYFGSLTKSAVSNFQARNGIATVGRVGPITLAAINAQMGGNTGADRSSPSIGVVTISPTNSGATFNWNTNENSSGIIYYSPFPISLQEAAGPGGAVTIGGSSFLANSDLRSSHSGTITGLQPNTNHYYVVYARDGSGNESITWPATFQTRN